MRQVIEDVLYPARAFERNHPNLLARVNEYLEKFDGAERTKEHIIRFWRRMSRYHDYRREILGEADFTLFVETVTLEQMNDFRDYVVNEYKLRQEHPDFYAPHTLINHRPRPLSGTTVINTMNLFCTFLHWCKRMKYSDNGVYALYGCKEPTYGDPFFLTSEERNILYDADLSDCPKLAVIRDIFVFHCYVGCRVSDLYRLTRDNIKDGFLKYMPQKTKKCQAKTVRLPLHEKALKILERYDVDAKRIDTGLWKPHNRISASSPHIGPTDYFLHLDCQPLHAYLSKAHTGSAAELYAYVMRDISGTKSRTLLYRR